MARKEGRQDTTRRRRKQPEEYDFTKFKLSRVLRRFLELDGEALQAQIDRTRPALRSKKMREKRKRGLRVSRISAQVRRKRRKERERHEVHRRMWGALNMRQVIILQFEPGRWHTFRELRAACCDVHGIVPTSLKAVIYQMLPHVDKTIELGTDADTGRVLFRLTAKGEAYRQMAEWIS